VDPWKRVITGKAPAATLPAPVVGAPTPRRADSGWFGDGERAAVAPKPVVEPRTRPSPVPDPTPRTLDPAAAAAPHPLHPTHWVRVVPEIIDPWGPGRLAAYQDPLIVDPWQN
jgi:hypothetical protein